MSGKQKIIKDKKGNKFYLIEEPVKEFKNNENYFWAGGTNILDIPDEWAVSMHFIADGKVHQCKKGDGTRASFFDCVFPDVFWDWGKPDWMQHFRLCRPAKD